MKSILSALLPPTLTTAQRNAIPAGRRAPGSQIYNSDTLRIEQNYGSDATPIWGPVGAVQKATSVAGLTAFDGAEAELRVGASPYEYIGLRYDATLGKWLSPLWTFTQGAERASNGSVGMVSASTWQSLLTGSSAAFSKMQITNRWYDLYNAGLRPQFRHTWYVNPNHTNSVTWAFRMLVTIWYNTGAWAGDGNSTGTTPVTTSSAGEYVVEENWYQPSLSVPASNWVLGLELFSNLSAAPNANFYLTQIVTQVRWVA